MTSTIKLLIAIVRYGSVINYDRKRDATIQSINLTTLESSFTIVMFLYYKPPVLLLRMEMFVSNKHSSLSWFNVSDEKKSFIPSISVRLRCPHRIRRTIAQNEAGNVKVTIL